MYQLRGCDVYGNDTGELINKSTLDEAMEMFLRGGWWKLSWTISNGKRVRLVREGNTIEITYM